MTEPFSFGPHPLIADTTVWSKLRGAPSERQEAFHRAVQEGLVLSSPIVRLEWLHDAENGATFDERDELFSTLRELPLSRKIGETAVSALRDLRQQGSPGYHRVRMPDALIAATAQENAVDVLHDNSHYEKLAEVLEFSSVRFI